MWNTEEEYKKLKEQALEEYIKLDRDEMLNLNYGLNRDMIFKIYKNKKSGNNYIIIGVAYDATNEREGNPVVVYFKKGDISEIKGVFCRDLDEFKEKFEYIGERVDFFGMYNNKEKML